MRAVAFVCLGSLATVLTGCGGLTEGSSKYGCSGVPDHPTCMSTTDVYKATEHADHVEGRGEPSSKGEGYAPFGTPSTDKKSVADKRQARPASAPYVSISAPDVTPGGPSNTDPLPVRTPSQVMRIYITPWEDKSGDLNASGYVYTEIEGRRWSVGQPVDKNPNDNLHPLQVTTRHDDASSLQDREFNPTRSAYDATRARPGRDEGRR